jgi:hypothetical protein
MWFLSDQTEVLYSERISSRRTEKTEYGSENSVLSALDVNADWIDACRGFGKVEA